MYKKLILSLVIFSLIVFGFTGGAYAYYSDANYTAIYMVGSDGSTIEKTTFAWNETPWLYINLVSPATEDHVHLDLTDPGATYWLG